MTGGGQFNCTEPTSSTGVLDVLVIATFVALLVVPFITTAYLAHRLRRGPAAAAV